MENICRFCNIAQGNVDRTENRPIYENDKYFSIASIGALVEGWVLIVPKQHSCSMKDVYASKEFIDFTNIVLRRLQDQYGPIIAFEHGPNRMDSQTSCGTNHAHLHLVPFESLSEDLENSGLMWEKCSSIDISSKVGDKEYLFYCELSKGINWDSPQGWLHILDKPISQYFRKVIAKRLNCIENYNYKTNPNLELTIQTQLTLSQAFSIKQRG